MRIQCFKLSQSTERKIKFDVESFSRRVATSGTSWLKDSSDDKGSKTITKFRNNMKACIDEISNGIQVELLPGTSLPENWLAELEEIEVAKANPNIYYTDLACEELCLKERCNDLVNKAECSSSVLVFDNTLSNYDDDYLYPVIDLGHHNLSVIIANENEYRFWVTIQVH